MPMTKTSMADKIVAKLIACNPNWTGASEAEFRACLEAFCEGIIEEIAQNANITMDAADFNVLPGTFLDSQSNSITGLGDNDAFDLTGKIN